jgi:arylsulfatase A-like enzyme
MESAFMKRTIYFIFALLLSVMLPSCGGGSGGASSAGAITAFALAGVTGTINETGKAIAVTMPFGTGTTALVATFTSTGASVKVGNTAQISGATANDFTSPVIYTVSAADGSTASYTVTVAVASPTQTNFTDNLTVDQGGFVDIPLHNSVVGDVLTFSASPVPVNGTLTLAADARSVRYQSNGIGVGEERFTLTTQRQQTSVEVHDVALLVRRTDARPNILFVLTDDQDVGMEQALPWTAANVRDQGIDFRNSFVPLSMCCPSRASILSGKYPHNHGVHTNVTSGWGGAPAFKLNGSEQQTFAVWLQQAGYSTALFGKYMNQYPEYAPRQVAPYNSPALVPPGWSEWYGAIDLVPDGDNPYLQFNYGLIENGVEVRYGAQAADYLGDVLTTKAETFITQSIRSQKPFLAYVSFISPHGPATPAPRHAGRFLGAPFLLGPAFNEADITDKPQWLKLNPLLTPSAIQAITALREKRHESLLSVDEGIQHLVDLLQRSGELSRTYIIFTSDNGWHMGEHQLPPNKGTAYEEDIRVPLWIRGPGIPAGRVNNDLVVNIDLAPTFNELAGNTPQTTVDGRSLVPLLNGTTPLDWRKRFLVEHYAAVPNFTPVPQPDPGWFEYFAVRDQSRIFVQYSYGDQEYYDLALDSYQMTNTVATVDPLVVQDLNGRLPALKACVGATCRAEESRP